MTSFFDAVRLLGSTFDVRGSSTDELATQVGDRSSKRTTSVTPKDPVRVVALDGSAPIRPIDALKRLSEGNTSWVQGKGLVSWLGGFWSTLKYLDAFASLSNGDLALNPSTVGRAKHHSRTLISEELGVAFGLELGFKWVREMHAGTPIGVINLDDEWLHPAGLSKTPGASKVPDFLIAFTTKSEPYKLQYAAVECKGTSGSNRAVGQLAVACEQLASIRYRQKSVSGLATAVISEDKGITYKAVDPGTELPSIEIMRVEASDALVPLAELMRSRLNERGTLDLSKPDQLLRHSVCMSYARLAAMGGNREAAIRWGMPTDALGFAFDRGRPAIRDVDGRTFQGTEIEIQSEHTGERAIVFQGVDDKVLAALAESEAIAIHQLQGAFSEQNEEPIAVDPAPSSAPTARSIPADIRPRDSDSTSAQSVASDGSMLEVSVLPN